jgi:GAF domain-containing protein
MALLLAVWLRWEAREHQAAILGELRVVSQQGAGQAQEFIEPVRELVMTLASLPPVRNLAAGPTQDLPGRFKSGFHRLANVFVYAADGRFIASALTRPGATPPTPTDRQWFRQALETGRPAVSDFLIGRVVGEPVIVVAAPVRSPGEALGAVVGASVTLRRLQDHFLNLPLAPGRTLLLVDGEGKVLAGRAEGGRPAGSTPGRGSIGREIRDDLRNPAPATLDGVPVLSALAPVPDTGCRVLAALPRARVEAMVWKEMRAIALPALGILGTVVLVGFVVGRRVWGPLQEVAGAVRAFAAGHFTPIPVRSSDEAGEIVAAFNSMGVAVQRQTRELSALFEVSTALAATLDRKEILALILAKTCQIMEVDMARIYLLDGDAQALEFIQQFAPAPGDRSEIPYISRLRLGEGVAGLAVTSRGPVQTADIRVDPVIMYSQDNRDVIARTPWRAVLAVPLISGEQVRGALAVADRTVRRFADDEVRVLAVLGSAAAVALQNAQLFAEAGQARDTARRERDRALALSEVGRVIVSSLDHERVLDVIVEKARDLLGARSVVVRSLDAASEALRIERAVGLSPAYLDRRHCEPMAALGVTGRAVAERRALWTRDNLEEAPGRRPPAILEVLKSEGFRAVLAVPIRSRQGVFGVLAVHKAVPHDFAPDEVTLAESLAHFAGIALDNARLVADLNARQARLAALLEANHQLAAIQPLDVVLAKIAEACGRLLDSDSVGFRLVEGDELVVTGVWGDAREAMPTPRIKLGESLSGFVASTGEPLVLRNLTEDSRLLPRHRDAVLSLGHRGWLGVPVKVGESVVGVLSIRTRREQGFSQDDLAAAAAFAAQAAIALQNARLVEAEHQSRAQAEALAEVGQALLAAESEDQILDRIIERARVLFDTNDCAILLPGTGEAEGRLVVRRGKGPWAEILAPGPTTHMLAPGEGVGGLAYARGTPVWSPDNLNDPAILLPPWLREVLQGSLMRAALSVPLMGPAVPIGVITVNRPTGHRFTPAEVGLLQRLATLAALALRQEALRAETRRHLEEVTNLGNVAREITSLLDLNRVLVGVTEAVRRLLGSELSTLAICDEPNGPATVVALAGSRAHQEAYRGNVLRPGVGLGGTVLATRASAWVEDFVAEIELPDDQAARAAASGIRGNLCAPLLWQGEVIGLLWACHTGPHRFTPAEVHTLERLADVAAIAIQNARLFSASRAQAAALAEKNAQLDSFVYVVSHDLKAPLITIEGMASILRENHANALDPEANHLLERIQANVRQLERLTEDLLALSRIGREARAPEPVDLTELVGRLLVEWDGPIRARGVQVDYGHLPTLQAIRTQMEQVIGNLLGNALKYLGDTPSPRVEIGAVEKDGVVECYVKDNGIGIDPAYHGRVFEIFHRLKEVEAEGTGVGLAIVKKIVEGAGGRVWVESVKGEGATFRFTWPKAVQESGDGSR